MTFTKDQQKIMLGSLLVLIALVNGYHFITGEKPKTAPLLYKQGAVASSPVRQGLLSRGSGADPLNVFLERHDERYPGVVRDFFKMETPIVRQKAAQVSMVKMSPTPLPAPVKTREEIAAEESRADLSKFRFLGYLTDKESTLFLSKDGELFIVKSGDRVLKNYLVKEASKDFVVLLDTVTRVEMRIDMSGSDAQQQTPQQQLQQPAQPPTQSQVFQPQLRRQMQKQGVSEMKQEMQQP